MAISFSSMSSVGAPSEAATLGDSQVWTRDCVHQQRSSVAVRLLDTGVAHGSLTYKSRVCDKPVKV